MGKFLPLLGWVLAGVLMAEPASCESWVDLNVGSELQRPNEQTVVDQTALVRLNTRYSAPVGITLNAHYGLAHRVRLVDEPGTGIAAAQSTGADLRLWDLPTELWRSDGDTWVIEQNLDTLHGVFYWGAQEFTVGRQPISLGVSRQFSPLDVVVPQRIGAQERSYRPGVDAVRWRNPLGLTGELDVGWVFGQDNLLFARATQQWGTVSAEFTALTLNQAQWIVGLSTQTFAGDWGLWQESAWLHDDVLSGARITLGADRSVWSDVYVVAEYHYNDVGDAENMTSDFFQKGLVTLGKQHYVALNASATPSPLVNLNLGLLHNIQDADTLLLGNVGRSLGNNTQVDATIEVPLAKQDSGTEFAQIPLRLAVLWSTVF
ncbi:hypothetical protein ACFOW2_10475 [Salinispirillum marinum]|uniref:Transporter n=1 Tax=Saccharospirillum mangrovi TaxID=2161747 RepID=A0ABV7ZXF3_9GAMM